MDPNKIYQGSSLDVLKTFPSESIDMSISSPPYWGLRDYGVEGQLGLEPTFEEFISHLCDIYDEVYRVLKSYGSCYVNLGDTYWGGGQAQGHTKDTKNMGKTTTDHGYLSKPLAKGNSYKDKCLCLIPFRFAIEMVNRGWILRNIITWKKPNGIPESVDDRFTKTKEDIFFFTKQPKYYFEQQLEEYIEPLNRYGGSRQNTQSTKHEDMLNGVGYGSTSCMREGRDLRPNPFGKNKRDVWEIPVANSNDSHFAVFPEGLIETPIKASCPKEVCVQCGTPKRKVYKRIGKSSEEFKQQLEGSKYERKQSLRSPQECYYREIQIVYEKCSCNVGFNKGIVLDPFMGSGTTAIVSEKLKVDWIGIELNPEYINIAEKRIQDNRNNYKPRITQIREGKKNKKIESYFQIPEKS